MTFDRDTSASLLPMVIPPVRRPGLQGGEEDVLKITPTDVAQFLRYESCERFLRLQLHARNVEYRFLEPFGLRQQELSPLLSRSGSDFEARVESALKTREAVRDMVRDGRWEASPALSGEMPDGDPENSDQSVDYDAEGVEPPVFAAPGESVVSFAARAESGDRRRKPDNEAVLQAARELEPGRTAWLLQPRLVVRLHGWELRGDVDLLRLRRDEDRRLQVLAADMKASPHPKLDQKLQVAFYHEMLGALLSSAGIEHEPIQCGVLYRGPLDPASITDAEALRLLAEHRAHAQREFGVETSVDGAAALPLYFDPMPDRQAFSVLAQDMVFNEDSAARRVASVPYEEVAWHLAPKCDPCPFSEWCLRGAAQDDDLSLLPHMAPDLKTALRAHGVRTVTDLAGLKTLKSPEEYAADRAADAASTSTLPTSTCEAAEVAVEDEVAEEVEDAQAWNELRSNPAHGALLRRLSSSRGVGARLDEMILRAHALRRRREGAGSLLRTRRKLARRGHGSLPFCSPDHDPNLVTLYIDAQHDFLQDRLCGLAALVVAHKDGEEWATRATVRLTPGPPKTAEIERELIEGWIRDTLAAVSEIAAPDAEGGASAPVHLVFFDAREQKELLDALGRHAESVLATPLFDFVTQLASFDSSLISFLDQEARERRNYPLTCPSLYETAAYLGFNWNEPLPFRQMFREKIFDGGGFLETLDDGAVWTQRRARYASQIPLEYAYAAWGELPPAPPKGSDAWAAFRGVDRVAWEAFSLRRLEAIRHVARDFEGNKLTSKRPFLLPDLAAMPDRAPDLADALQEFLIIERHATLGTWKAARHAPPERRALAGDSLVVSYREEDQAPGVAEQMRRNAELQAEIAAWRAENPGKNRPRGSPKPDFDLELRLRLEPGRSQVSAREILALSPFSPGQRIILAPRLSVDGRLPRDEQFAFQTTAKQLLYSPRGVLEAIEEPAEESRHAWLRVRLCGFGQTDKRGFVFSGRDEVFRHGQVLSIEEEVSDIVGSHALTVLQGLREHGARNALLDRLQNPQTARSTQNDAAAQAQQRFMDGLEVLARRDAALKMESSKQEFIARHNSAPFLLVQGPPGTGKTYASSFALWARLQGAVAAGCPLRVLVSCQTHSAIDVLLRGLAGAKARLEQAQREEPEVFAKYFDDRLLAIPVVRFNPKDHASWEADPANAALEMLLEKRHAAPGQGRADRVIEELPYCIVGATPNACYKMCAETGKVSGGALFGHEWWGALVVDEASQMPLPNAVMASLALEEDAPVIIVGDPRQMPPIIAHDWRNESRRTFASFKPFVSLYDAISSLDQENSVEQVLAPGVEQVLAPGVEQVLAGGAEAFKIPRIRFSESFRLHRDMAEFLRREIYARDGIHFHSNRSQTLHAPRTEHADGFVRAVLDPAHALIVVTHRESNSVLSNAFEHELVRPVLEALAGAEEQNGHALDATKGLGVVVPHRAQRALMSDPARRWNVDTVERFQGDEREAMLFCATESERGHLNRAAGFLFDPRRLNVALSRAKRKMILVASREVFSAFFADEEAFFNAMLWKNLLRHTCTVDLWRGERNGVPVEVWGGDPDWH